MELIEGRATVEDPERFVGELQELGEEYGATVQAFDARYVAGREHLRTAVERADRAIGRGENVARDRAMEILLYAAGRRQIDQALEMGVPEGEAAVVVLVDGGDETTTAEAIRERLEPGETSADEDRLRDFFDVTDRELTAAGGDLGKLVRERVALLDVRK